MTNRPRMLLAAIATGLLLTGNAWAIEPVRTPIPKPRPAAAHAGPHGSSTSPQGAESSARTGAAIARAPEAVRLPVVPSPRPHGLGLSRSGGTQQNVSRVLAPTRSVPQAVSTARLMALPPMIRRSPTTPAQVGVATWYGGRFHGRRTASGEVFNRNALTAAHRTLPFGTKLRVTNTRTGKSVVVRVNDRGPHSRRFLLDLSQGAAQQIGMSGSSEVRIEIVPPGTLPQGVELAER